MKCIVRTVGAIACVLYVASLCALAMPFGVQGIFVSPDEHATWVFAHEVASTGIAAVQEVRNEALDGFLHPRSAVTIGASIVPAGFLGMPYVVGALYFLSPYLAAITGPIFGVLGLCALYHIVKKLGASREFTVVSVVALALHPAWWYYSTRSLMPNVPLVALILCAGWIALSVQTVKKSVHRLLASAASGALLACAIFIRPSEWLWLTGSLFTIALLIPLRTYKKEIASGLFGFALIAAIAFALHSLVYGGVFTTGYTVDIPAWEVGGEITGSNVPWYEKVFALLFPFGIHEKATLRNAWNYLFVVYPWMTAIALMGGLLLVPQLLKIMTKTEATQKRKHIAAIVITVLSAGYLVTLYGSWTFFDNPDPNVISLGNSHVRYWLPLVVLSAPLAAHAILFIKQKGIAWSMSDRSRSLARAFPGAVLILLGALSTHTVFAGEDGVLRTREALGTFTEKRDQILATTPKDAIIIVDRADKYLWPDRAVVVPLRTEETYAQIPQLLDVAPLYYFGITLPEEDLVYLRDVIFAGAGIAFTPVVTIQEETLYVITR